MRILKSFMVLTALVVSFLGSCIDSSAQSKPSLVPGFKEIRGVLPSGDLVKLSDYMGKGNYVLVDFWASWCGPCRQEIPNIISVWEKYKGKGLTVLGIAVSDEKEDTLKAAKDLGIEYDLMLEPRRSSIIAYGIYSIPALYLFAPDGSIVAKDMRGEGIEKAVKSALEAKK